MFVTLHLRVAAPAVMRLANLHGSGGLRTCTNTLRLTTKIAENKGHVGPLSADALHAVRSLLATRRDMQRVADRMDTEEQECLSRVG